MTLEQQLEVSIVMAGIKKDLAAGKAADKAALDRIVAEYGLTARLFVMPAPAPISGGLPAELYYSGGELTIPAPPILPIDETRPLTGMDRDARALAAQGRAGLVRFFAGRGSQRLGKVVRPA